MPIEIKPAVDQVAKIKSTMTAEKVDDNTIQITTQPIQLDPVVQTYDYDFLLSQRDAIQAQMDEQMAQRQAELDEVNALIELADEQGIVAKPAQPAEIQTNVK
jgi:hypothetical protein